MEKLRREGSREIEGEAGVCAVHTCSSSAAIRGEGYVVVPSGEGINVNVKPFKDAVPHSNIYLYT